MLIGTADLAVSLGYGGDVPNSPIEQAFARVATAAHAAGVPCGIAAGTVEHAAQNG